MVFATTLAASGLLFCSALSGAGPGPDPLGKIASPSQVTQGPDAQTGQSADPTEPKQEKRSRKKDKNDTGDKLEHKYDRDAVDLTEGGEPEVVTKVLAKENDWQSSGVTVRKGAEYRIAAEGEWKAGPACRWTKADGQRSATVGCWDVLVKIVKKYSGSALVAKVGEEGEPFAVGNEMDLKAGEEGILFFRINKAPGMTWENEGYLTVTVSLDEPVSGPEGDRGVVAVQDVGTEEPSVSGPPAREMPQVQSRRWAVVIGISEYQDSRIPTLRYASTDATAFYDWLVSPEGGRYPPSQVRLLLNDAATARMIREALFSWLGQAIEEDIVTIYFAGHGSPDTPDTPENLYLLPYDAQYGSIASTGFPMWDVETALERFIDARRVVVIADACHSGGVGEAFDVARRGNPEMEANPVAAGLQGLTQVGDGIAVISAADDNQFSYEGQQYGGGHGVFTYYLLEGLGGEADYNKDGSVTLGELIPFLSEQVRRATRNAQSPTIAGKFDPAITLGR